MGTYQKKKRDSTSIGKKVSTYLVGHASFSFGLKYNTMQAYGLLHMQVFPFVFVLVSLYTGTGTYTHPTTSSTPP